MATATTSIRLSPLEKRRIAALARKSGLSPSAYIKHRALAEWPDSRDAKFAKLEKIAGALIEAVEDERDARLGDAIWENHLKNKTRLYTGEEVWREMGLSF